MKETEFISQHRGKWKKFEDTYSSARKKPEELSALYLELSEDLAYAQTFYKRRSIRAYLNSLSQKVFMDVHRKGEGENKLKLIDALTISLPLELYRARKSMFFALLSFLVYAVLGAVTTHFYPEFPRSILGDLYVEQTLQNIQEGHPLAVYDTNSPFMMFYSITVNNLQIAFLLFTLGLFATLGTHAILFVNGIMLGSFQLFFYQQGLLSTSFLGIWIHGAFEISTIVIAGGAGITLGSGWLFPKSYTRIQSLRLSVVRSLKIVFSIVPFIVFAGFLESFVTHNYQLLPSWSKWSIILFSFAIILSYYVIYPFIVAKKYPHLLSITNISATHTNRILDFYKIRSLWTTISDSFLTYFFVLRKVLPFFLLIILPVSLILLSIQNETHEEQLFTLHFFDWYVHSQIIFGFGKWASSDFWIATCWSVVIVFVFALVFWSLKRRELSLEINLLSYLKERFFRIYVAFIPSYALFFFTPLWLKPILLFVVPFFVLIIAYVGLNDDKTRFLRNSFSLTFHSYRYSLQIILFFLCFLVVVIQPIASVFSIHETHASYPWLFDDLLDIVADFVYKMCLTFAQDEALYYANIFRQCVYLLFFFFTLPLFVLLISFGYFSKIEQYQAIGLYRMYDKFGQQKKDV